MFIIINTANAKSNAYFKKITFSNYEVRYFSEKQLSFQNIPISRQALHVEL